MATEKKQSFFGGAAVLAAGVVIVKIIGALFKIPLANILGETGNADFNNAYNIYAVLLTISTAGLPVALSKMISEAKTLGRERQARRVLKVSFAAFLTLGGLSFVIMWFGNEKCAALLNNPTAAYGIKALAPGVVCVGCLAAFRGFAQGSFRMTPTAVSQIIEAVSKLFIGLGLSMYVVSLGYEDYIAAAEPVGSKALAEEMGGSVSSATIRNELADLVEMGYLEQPHTSAGRVPSPKGYRLYVNELMEKREVSETEAEEINEQLKSKLSGTDSVIAKAGQMVSSIVNYPVYSVTGGRREASVKRFELIAVDEMSFIVVVMGEDNRVKSQLQRSDLPFDSQRLADVKELLNTHFTGRSADEMSARLMSLSEQLSPELFLVVSKAVEYAIGVLEQSAQRNVETAGASQILKMPEYRDVDKAHDLVTFLVDNKEELPVPDDGAPLKILIGPENVNEALKETSVVVASYDIGDGMRGLVGVVGPTRMDYATVTARLSYFADSLTRMFGKNELPPREEDKE